MAKSKKDKKLINIIYQDLEKHGNYEKLLKGSFDDGSSSWIEAYHKLGPNENGNRYIQFILFNGEGTEIEDINIFEEKMAWEENQKKID